MDTCKGKIRLSRQFANISLYFHLYYRYYYFEFLAALVRNEKQKNIGSAWNVPQVTPSQKSHNEYKFSKLPY